MKKKKVNNLFKAIKNYKRDQSKKNYKKMLVFLVLEFLVLFVFIDILIRIHDIYGIKAVAYSLGILTTYGLHQYFYNRSIHLLYVNEGLAKNE